MLELGAGTGVISRALLASGRVAAGRLITMEIVPTMADHLRRMLPDAHVMHG